MLCVSLDYHIFIEERGTQQDQDDKLRFLSLFGWCHSCSSFFPSHAHGASSSRLHAAESAERAKLAKYTALAHKSKVTFYPFAVESIGDVGKHASLFLQNLTREALSLRYAWVPREVVYGIRHSVAVAVQKGNASIISSSLFHNYR